MKQYTTVPIRVRTGGKHCGKKCQWLFDTVAGAECELFDEKLERVYNKYTPIRCDRCLAGGRHDVDG